MWQYERDALMAQIDAERLSLVAFMGRLDIQPRQKEVVVQRAVDIFRSISRLIEAGNLQQVGIYLHFDASCVQALEEIFADLKYHVAHLKSDRIVREQFLALQQTPVTSAAEEKRPRKRRYRHWKRRFEKMQLYQRNDDDNE